MKDHRESVPSSRRSPLTLWVRVQPRATEDAVVGRYGDALKVRVCAPAESGRANTACRRLLADVLGVQVEQIRIRSGNTARRKRIVVTGPIPPQKLERLAGLLPPASLG